MIKNQLKEMWITREKINIYQDRNMFPSMNSAAIDFHVDTEKEK